MKKPHVLISGAGIAGPALALCLGRAGIRSTVVERAPALRDGGQAVDFRGPVHRMVLERLDLWNAIHARRTRPSSIAILDRAGVARATLPEIMMSGDVEILRGDLARLLHDRSLATTEYRFGDHITAIDARPDRVEVGFASGGTETFDFVVGADGLHSGVRALAFTDEARVLRHHGYRIGTFTFPVRGDASDAPRVAMVYSEPGRALTLTRTSAYEARAMFIYTGGPFTAESRDGETQKRALRERFAGMGWEAPRVLDALERATDLYVDAIATVHVERYARGRVALLGDAAYGGTLGGQGTPLAIIGAYVLAGEMARGSDHRAAFARYEATLRPYASRCQKGAMRVGGFFAPKTAAGIWLRNAMYAFLTSGPMLKVFERLVTGAATDLMLPDYA